MCSKYSALAGVHWQCLWAFQQGLFIYCQYHLDIDSVCRPFNRGCLLTVPFGQWHCRPFNRGCLLSVPFGHWQCLWAFQQGLFIVSTIWTVTVFVGLSTGAVYWQYHLEWNQHRATGNQSAKHFTQLDCHNWCSTWKTQTDKGMEKRYIRIMYSFSFMCCFSKLDQPFKITKRRTKHSQNKLPWACSHTRTDACMHKHI